MVTDEAADRRRCGGGGDEVVAGPGKERHLLAAILQEFVGIAVSPVVLDAGAEAQVLDSRAARVEDTPEVLVGVLLQVLAILTTADQRFSVELPGIELGP